MSDYRTPLRLELMRDARGLPLRNRAGRQLWLLLCDLVYFSDVAGLVIVPAGFVTDLASVPRWALSLIGETAHEASVPHDFAYNLGVMSRALADEMLYEACILAEIPKWKAKLIYAGVRLGGWAHYIGPPEAAPAI